MSTEVVTPTILIVDDERIARDIMEGQLMHEGYTLLLAGNSFKALEYLERASVDLVLLDVLMPHLDGIQVCQRIKTDERWRHIPVILFSGFWDKEMEERGQEVHADGFLKKPIDGHELRTKVRLLLDR